MAHNQNALLQQISELIYKSPDSSLNEIAKSVEVERHTIEKAVQRHLSTSFRQWRLMTIMRRAEEFLEASNLGIKEIAALSGYRSASAFSRAFKNTRGITPVRFRRRITSGTILFWGHPGLAQVPPSDHGEVRCHEATSIRGKRSSLLFADEQ
jgi:transcriptional regulator GlxA family with amidase domain